MLSPFDLLKHIKQNLYNNHYTLSLWSVFSQYWGAVLSVTRASISTHDIVPMIRHRRDAHDRQHSEPMNLSRAMIDVAYIPFFKALKFCTGLTGNLKLIGTDTTTATACIDPPSVGQDEK